MSYSGKAGFPSKSTRKIMLLAGIAGIGCGLAFPSLAAEKDAATDVKLDEIVVTASRRSQAMEKVPYNISAYTGAALENNNISDISKLSRSIAGLQMSDRGVRDNTASMRLVSRGLNTETATLADLPFVTANPVAIYIDETPIMANLRLIDVKRVEFLRGPQGTLYGAGSLGGTLKFISNEPKMTETSGRIEVSAGMTKDAGGPDYSINGVLNLPLSDKLAVRVSGGYDYYHGYIDGTRMAVLDASGAAVLSDPLDINSPPLTKEKKDFNSANVAFVHGAIRFEPSDIWSIQLSAHYQREKARNRDAQTLGAKLHSSQVYLDEPAQREMNLVSLEIGADLGFAAFTSSSAYYKSVSKAITDGTGLYTALGYLAAPSILAPIQLNSRDRTYTQEFRLVSKTNSSIDWLVGGFYMDDSALALDEYDYFRGEGLFGNPNTNSNDLFVHLKRTTGFKDLAAFGELTYHLSSKWQAIGGIRVFHQKFSSDGFFDFPAFGFYPGSPNHSTEKNVLFKANTSYQFSSSLNLYAVFSQGFRRGGANSIPTSGPLAEPIGLVSYKSDRVNNYEIGAKGHFPIGLRYSVSLYYIDWKNAQLGTLSPVFGYDVAVNAGDAKSQGLEMEVSGQLVDNLDFTMGYAYTDAKLREGFSGYVTGQAGARLPGVSRHTLTGSLDYNVPMKNDDEVFIHLDGSYRSKFSNNVDRNATSYRQFKGFPIFAASIGYKHDNWRLTLAAENIFDEKAISAQGDPATSTPEYMIEWGTRPRSISLNLAYEF